MVREVLTLNIGQCGIQLSSAIWTQYCTEHNISPNGILTKLKNDPPSTPTVFFEETSTNQYVPRNISIDLESNVIDSIKNSEYGNLYNNDFFIYENEDAANIFSRGKYTVGRDIMDKCKDKIRKLVNNCDNIQGFLFNNSVAGGTGSGLTTNILEFIALEYRKIPKIGFEVYPSPNLSNCVVDPYNSLLTTSYLIDFTEISTILDNESLYNICSTKLDLNKKNKKRPSYSNINRLITKVISSITVSTRFKTELAIDISDFQTNLVPFPKLHFMTTSMSPITTIKKKETYKNNIKSITEQCFNYNNFFVKLDDFDVDIDKYMSILLNFRGNVNAKDANLTVDWIKHNNKANFVDWVPTGFKIGLNEVPCKLVKNDDLASFDKEVVMIANNTSISRVFSERICKKYDLLYSQRAYVHWYVGEGMEEGEFDEARESLSNLEKDYLDVLSEEITDEDSNDNDNETENDSDSDDDDEI